jgi:hypothetical protein
MRLFYRKDTKSKLIGYADAGYLSDPHKARSQSGYVHMAALQFHGDRQSKH